ncbi:hypothetical protein [Actinotalea subterranea]|uniref:hypothetical protein n=1 Tax=Actinotalea subterranea TaxID=2607497 RepID=UPI00165DE98D|nr:hypothetical protein [Actinotalea subterranea]
MADIERGQIDPLDPSPVAVADRIRRWWSLRPWLAAWGQEQAARPLALVGLSGRPAYRFVTGAIDLQAIDWSALEVDGSSIGFPFPADHPATDDQLDAFQLRGRVVTGIAFSNLKHELVRIYGPGGLIPRPV